MSIDTKAAGIPEINTVHSRYEGEWYLKEKQKRSVHLKKSCCGGVYVCVCVCVCVCPVILFVFRNALKASVNQIRIIHLSWNVNAQFPHHRSSFNMCFRVCVCVRACVRVCVCVCVCVCYI